MNRFALVVLVVLISACESDAAKYGRLDQELLRAKLRLGNVEARFDSLTRFEKGLAADPTPGPRTLAYADTVEAARTEVALLQRQMSKFTGGH